MDADPHAFLKKLTEKELKFSKALIKNSHMPYDTKRRTFVVSTGTGRAHKRVKTPWAHCLSLDICGPFRNRGMDPDRQDCKYALIGAYCLPKFDGEIGDNAGKFSGEIGNNPGKFDGQIGDNAGNNAGKFDARIGDNAGKSSKSTGIEAAMSRGARDDDDDLPPNFRVLFGEANEDLPVPGRAAQEAEGLHKGLSKEFDKIFKESRWECGVSDKLHHEAFEIENFQGGCFGGPEHDSGVTCKVARMYADRARELRTVPLRRWMLDRGIYCTYIEGQAPEQWTCGVNQGPNEETPLGLEVPYGDLAFGNEICNLVAERALGKAGD